MPTSSSPMNECPVVFNDLQLNCFHTCFHILMATCCFRLPGVLDECGTKRLEGVRSAVLRWASQGNYIDCLQMSRLLE